MKSKTCGECCGFSESENRCLLLGGRGEAYADNKACGRFSEKKTKPRPTNLDMIRQMNDEDLIKVLSDGCPPFSGNSDKCEHPDSAFSCKDCWREWLNAPAESEGKDE